MKNIGANSITDEEFFSVAYPTDTYGLGIDDIQALIDLAATIKRTVRLQESTQILECLESLLEVSGCAFGVFDPSKKEYVYITSSFPVSELPNYASTSCSADGVLMLRNAHGLFTANFQHLRKTMYQFFVVRTDGVSLTERQMQIITYLLPSIYSAAARLSYINFRLMAIGLTSREYEVARWILEGKDNWSIAKILGVGERTVKFHNCNLFKKLSVNNRSELIVLYHKAVVAMSAHVQK